MTRISNTYSLHFPIDSVRSFKIYESSISVAPQVPLIFVMRALGTRPGSRMHAGDICATLNVDASNLEYV
jgi:hypothetical protein